MDSRETRNYHMARRKRLHLIAHRLISSASLIIVLSAQRQSSGQTVATHDQEISRIAQQADADLHNQKTTIAIEEYRKIIALDHDNIQAHANLGLAFYLQADFAKASEQFQAALQLKPDLWQTAALCGISENRIGLPAAAEVHLQQAFDHVDDPKLRIAVGRQLFSILFDTGDLDRASGIAKQLQKLAPSDIDVLYAADQVYSLLANRAFRSIAQLAPDSARMYELRGNEMMREGKLRSAITAYDKAIARDPHLSGAHFALAEALNTSQLASDRTKAESEYVKALADNDRDESAECRLGAIAMEHTDMDSARKHYRRALELRPDDPEANEGLGIALMATDSATDAIVYLRRAVELDPSDDVALYHLSLANRNLGNREAAKHEMDEYRRLKAQKESLRHDLHELSDKKNVSTTQTPQ